MMVASKSFTLILLLAESSYLASAVHPRIMPLVWNELAATAVI
jgi:hypothetical protein